MDNKEKGSNNEKNEIRQIEIRIAQVMQIQDGRKREDCVKKIILDLQKILENEKYKEFYQKRNLVSGMNIDLSSKLRFLMLASKISYTCYENFGNDRILSILKYNPYIIETEDFFDFCFNDVTLDFHEYFPEFIKRLKEDEELEKDFASYFKEVHFARIRDQYFDLSFFPSLPWFQKTVLTDERFICDYLGEYVNADNYFSFFKGLPKGYEYLISLYGQSRGLLELYYTHFYNRVKHLLASNSDSRNNNVDAENKAIYDFFDLQERINYDYDNPFKIDRYHRVRELKEALKNVLIDKEFYPNLKLIQKKSNLDFKSVVVFAYKYYGTEFFNVLINHLSDTQALSNGIEEKIQYLAKSGKKEEVERLINIDKISLKQLKKMKREKRETVNSQIRGGPDSETNIHFMPDSDDSDIIAIFPDGRENNIHCKGTQRKPFSEFSRSIRKYFWL